MPALNKLLLLATLVATPALAGNVAFLKDSPLSKMNNEDLELLRAAARSALNHTEDGAQQRWENPQSGAAGVLTPLETFDRDGTHCRRLEIFNDARGSQGRSVQVFCRQPDGTWKAAAR